MFGGHQSTSSVPLAGAPGTPAGPADAGNGNGGVTYGCPPGSLCRSSQVGSCPQACGCTAGAAWDAANMPGREGGRQRLW